MPNKYCNLVPNNKVKNEYTKITNGFAAVEADMEANDTAAQAGIAANTAALVAHKTTDAAVHPADKITQDGPAGGPNVQIALNSLKTDINNLAIGGTDHDPLVTAALVDAEGENFGSGGSGGGIDARMGKWEQKAIAHMAENAQKFAEVDGEIEDLQNLKADKTEVNALATGKVDKAGSDMSGDLNMSGDKGVSFGGGFKIKYNAALDSLDIEVI